MGYSYSQDDGPVMCFNGAKSWQTGWYNPKSAVVTPSTGGCFEGNLYGIADFGNAASSCARPDQRLDCIKPRLLRRIQPPNWNQFANPGGLEPSHGHPTGRRGHSLCRVGIDGQARCRWNLECKCQWQDNESHRSEHQRIKLSWLCSGAHLRGR
jgi:hypothetical protein